MLVQKTTTLILALLAILTCRAQTVLQDDFNDGDLGKSPTWGGDLADFTTINGQLQLKASGSGTSFISTPADWADTASWSFYFALDFSPSTSNMLKVYLSYDRANLTEPGNGLYLKVGRSGNDDNLELYRQKGNSATKLGEGTLGTLGGNYNQAHVQVSRSRQGRVRVLADFSGANKPILDIDLTEYEITSGSHVGISCTYTSTRSDKFYFDDLRVAPLYRDSIPPYLSSLTILSSSRLSLAFNESLDSASAVSPLHYLLSGQPATQAHWQRASANQVELELASPLVSGSSYTLIISGIMDLSGNTATSIQWSFEYYMPAWGHVLINECMADPSPSQGLPDAEFVELYNHTSSSIDLKGWTLTDGASTAVLPAHVLAPGAYLILCPGSQAAQFEPYGQALAVSLPALNNTGDRLVLRSANNILIDKIAYTLDWYRDEDKGDGGFSLERNSRETTCTGAHHWQASAHPQGGTPGAVNSVFSNQPDTTPPSLEQAIALSSNELALYFTENIDSSTALWASYRLSGYGGTITATQVLPSGKPSLRLTLSPGIDPNLWYDLTIDGVRDCKGNKLQKTYNKALMYLVPKPPKRYDVVISEIMADPEPSQGLPTAEFVEVYNRRPWPIGLAGCVLTDGRDTARIDSLILYPNQYVVLCASSQAPAFASYGASKGLSKFPSLNNTGETLYLRSAEGGLLHMVEYSDAWYGSDAKKEGGYSLEMVDSDNPCGRESNWTGAREGTYASPGKPNSQRGTNPDVTAPLLLGAFALDSNRVEIIWSETMRREQLASIAGYSITSGINILSSSPVDSTWTGSLLSLGNALQAGQPYTLTATGFNDCVGNRLVDAGVELALPETPGTHDIVVNEVLFNPYTGGSDFVELYNNSNKYIDLRELLMGRAEEVGLPIDVWPVYGKGYLLAPGGYVALCTNPGNIAGQYAVSETYLLPAKLPTLPDSEGDIGIYSHDTTLLDALHYLDDWHYPLLANKEGISLERVDPAGPTQSPSNWRSAASWCGGATPGYENSQYKPETPSGETVTLSSSSFSPDNDGHEDVVVIRISASGNASVSIRVFNLDGQLVRNLVPHDLLGVDSRYAWDGLDDLGLLQPVGIYILYIEMVDLETGKVQVVKKSVVRAAKM